MSATSKATVRIFLCTYRRNQLLRRAMKSLLDQTLSDWVCELHNDAPDDPFPSKLAAEIHDPRFIVVNHNNNLGGVGTFNLMFGPNQERYISLLEDDNWWEPEFLETMVGAMDSHPNIKVGWSNMRFWQEEMDGTWTDLKKNVWERPSKVPVELFDWPNYVQADTALHSTGAMLIRSGTLEDFKIPIQTMFEFADPVRERAMPHPLLFIAQPLVNFSLTLETARDKSPKGRLEHYVLLIASFFKHVQADDHVILQIWERKRRCSVRATHILILAGLADSNCRRLLHYAKASEWILFFLIGLKHLSLYAAGLRARSRYPDLWTYLDHHTARRVVEGKAKVGCKRISTSSATK